MLRSAVLATVLAAATLTLPAAAHAAEPTRVLIVGDSITQGRAGDVTWRYHYWDAFRSNVDLVGPKQGQWSPESDETLGQYPHAFDVDHASRWGMSLSYMQWSVADLMTTYTPDVVVSQLGVNDLAYMTDPAGLIAGQRSFVEQVRAVDPDADVVLGQLSPNWHAEMADYNALLPALVAELDTPASRVVMATMPPMTSQGDSYDGLHPTAAGEVKIAGAQESALVSLGVQPWPEPTPVVTEPAPAPVLEAPSKPRKVKAVRKGKRVKVSWRRAARAEIYVVRCGKARRETVRLRVRVKSPVERCRVRAVNEAGASRWVRAK